MSAVTLKTADGAEQVGKLILVLKMQYLVVERRRARHVRARLRTRQIVGAVVAERTLAVGALTTVGLLATATTALATRTRAGRQRAFVVLAFSF